MNKSTLYIGIDPGKDGYICINYKGKIEFRKMPMISKKVFDVQKLSDIMSDIKDLSNSVLFTHCVLEDVHAVFGSAAGSTFAFGYGCGLVEMALVCNKIPFSKVAPKKWQKEMFEGVPLIQKSSSTGKTMVSDTKKMAEVAAKRLFPDIDFKDTARCTTSHDGKIDATLMCEYSKRNY